MRMATAFAGMAAAAISLSVVWALQPCGLLDRSGCVARFTVKNFASVGDTLTAAPDGDGLVWVGGVQYVQGRHSGRPVAETVVVKINVEDGQEVTRHIMPFEGLPAQLVVSEDGRFLWTSMNAIYTRSVSLALLDSNGQVRWAEHIEEDDAIPDAEGFAFDLTVAANGDALAGPVAFDQEGTPILPRPVQSRRIDSENAEIDLPSGFVPMTRSTFVPSPDGKLAAILVRSFHGTDPAAVLEIRKSDEGTMLVRYEIDRPLSPALVWDPLGRGVVVATASSPGDQTDTEIRIYALGVAQ